MAVPSTTNYPVYYAVSEDNKVARWRPFVQLIMALPHLFIGGIMNYASQFCVMISWFVVVITGKLPAGLANFIIMVQRYNARAGGYAFGLTEQYPPFDFSTTAGDPGDYAIRLDVNPALEKRNRLTVFFRFFIMIPIMIFWYVMVFASGFVAMIAWFAVIATGRYPVGMRNFVIKAQRLSQKVIGYVSLLTDEYPPFSLD